METAALFPGRVKPLNDREVRPGQYVLYWMQQAQRARFNHAVEYAVLEANRLKLPLLVGFGLTDAYPEANLRHYVFMLEGLRETQAMLAEREIRMVVRKGSPPEVALTLGGSAALIVCDRGYLRTQRSWRETLAREAACLVVQVESDTVVPVETASGKAEYAARTIRPRIRRHLEGFLEPVEEQPLRYPSLALEYDGLDLSDLAAVAGSLRVDRSVGPVRTFKGGYGQARSRLNDFLEHRLEPYARNRNQPQTEDVSGVSPYLHFGQISPLELALEVNRRSQEEQRSVEVFLEELLVRRELAVNFVEYTPDYDDYSCLPPWAARTLGQHTKDPRAHVYSAEQLENARTHDPYWNAAMKEMRHTGFMHNYMRMYWGKKILEWTRTPEEGFLLTISLNNKYFLDGRDPNSYAGVAWVYGVHDRPWGERPIFGTVRYMSAGGLERKCDIQGYVDKVNRLVRQETGE